ncbi:nitronate monooxygenase [Kiritimatiella glycovorans]|nr:nitronate monooxygenase [Kiritimatiella glycovorans]
MGAGVSHWRLARAVCRRGQLGVVSGTGLDQIMIRRLELGDPGGHVRRALEHFPLRSIARRIFDTFYIPGGKEEDAPFSTPGMHTVEGNRPIQALCIAANYVEVWLAREGHGHPVGINYLEKIQLPHLPSLYGAMLAGVGAVIVGAGIPTQFPAAIERLSRHEPAEYVVDVAGSGRGAEDARMKFDPRDFQDPDAAPLAPLNRPEFVPIVSSHALANILFRKAGKDAISGFILEGSRAGGHNAPPRGKLQLSANSEPVYGPRDVIDLDAVREIGLPFWLAGYYGSREGVRSAIRESAAGVQVGTAFALCRESGIDPGFRRALLDKALAGEGEIFTDIAASPTGFPFKVAALEGTLSDPEVYRRRKRVCDLGFLRRPYRRENGTIGYRCPSEPVEAYTAKGGLREKTEGRKCLCNALVANIGMPQPLGGGEVELPLITLGDDFSGVARFCPEGERDYGVDDVLRVLLG